MDRSLIACVHSAIIFCSDAVVCKVAGSDLYVGFFQQSENNIEELETYPKDRRQTTLRGNHPKRVSKSKPQGRHRNARRVQLKTRLTCQILLAQLQSTRRPCITVRSPKNTLVFSEVKHKVPTTPKQNPP